MDQLLDRAWHAMDLQEVTALLETHQEIGLSGVEVKGRLETFGPNTLTAKKAVSPVKRFLLQFHNPLVYILLTSAAVTGVLQEWVDFSVILGVVLVNAVIGYIQEAKAEQAIEALKRVVSTEATVIRDGETERIASDGLVPGDVVLLESGDKVPADLRLFQSKELRISESALTGESLPVEKAVPLLDKETVLADRFNMTYSGTLVASGRGRGLVVATGNQTETGRISNLINQATNLETPLTRKIAGFSRLLLWVILGLAGVTLVIGLLRRQAFVEVFMSAVALAVGAIPEGLPAAVTITLAIGVNRMAKKRAIIRKMPAVETLGSTTVICSDKTGTLTKNEMTVQVVYAGGEHFSLTGTGYDPDGHVQQHQQVLTELHNQALLETFTAGVLCNDAGLKKEQDLWKVQGDPTEAALLVSAQKAGVDQKALLSRLPRVDMIPFESERQYMATLHDTGKELPNLIYLKGSVEKVLARCTEALSPQGKSVDLDKGAVLKEAEEMAAQGLRVLALAKRAIGNEEKSLECAEELDTPSTSPFCGELTGRLIFLGLQAMVDPPRPEAITSIHACRQAGINVKMITGDHVLTAKAIAGQLGLGDENDEVQAISGQELEAMSDHTLLARLPEVSVFARVAPEQKLRLVNTLQTLGQVVAMTGDGVNDAPALKQADIGVAMGKGGTEVAKEASDMLLTDDNFATIEKAVEEGRGVFDNLTKFIVWTLPTNLGEGLVILAAIVAGITLPILPVQILWINMTTAVLLGLMLAFETKEPGIMARPPRDPNTPIITAQLVVRIILVAALMLIGAFGLFEWELRQGGDVDKARTTAVNVFVMIEMIYLLNCRSLTKSMFHLGVFSNPMIIIGMLTMLLLQLLYTYAPFMQQAFKSAPIGGKEWLMIAILALTAYFLVGLEKWINGRRRRGALK